MRDLPDVLYGAIDPIFVFHDNGALSVVLDDHQELDVRDGFRAYVLHLITCHLKRRVRAARRRGERI